MRRTRTNVLLVAVLALAASLAFRLLLSESGHAAPPQPRLTRVPPAGSDNAAAPRLASVAEESPAAERRYAQIELDLLPLGMERGGRDPMGPRYIGTNSAEAAALLKEAQAALSSVDPGPARALVRRALDLDPDCPQLLVAAAVEELKLSDDHLAEAERCAQRAATLAPMYAEAHYNLACALARQRRVPEAAAELGDAIQWGIVRGLNVRREARRDTDFDSVRGTLEFAALLGGP